jgi:hypothetical protein
MPSKSKTPHKGGASQISFGGCFCDQCKAQPLHRQAALALLNKCPELTQLTHKEAGFLGHVSVAAKLSPKQQEWLGKLLDRHGLSPLAEGGEQ